MYALYVKINDDDGDVM